MEDKRLKEAREFNDNYIRDVVGVEPYEIPTYIAPLEHWPLHLRDLIDKVKAEPKILVLSQNLKSSYYRKT